MVRSTRIGSGTALVKKMTEQGLGSGEGDHGVTLEEDLDAATQRMAAREGTGELKAVVRKVGPQSLDDLKAGLEEQVALVAFARRVRDAVLLAAPATSQVAEKGHGARLLCIHAVRGVPDVLHLVFGRGAVCEAVEVACGREDVAPLVEEVLEHAGVAPVHAAPDHVVARGNLAVHGIRYEVAEQVGLGEPVLDHALGVLVFPRAILSRVSAVRTVRVIREDDDLRAVEVYGELERLTQVAPRRLIGPHGMHATGLAHEIEAPMRVQSVLSTEPGEGRTECPVRRAVHERHLASGANTICVLVDHEPPPSRRLFPINGSCHCIERPSAGQEPCCPVSYPLLR